MAAIDSTVELTSLLDRWAKEDEEGKSPIETLTR